MENRTWFILAGLTDNQRLQLPLLITFFLIYTITFVGNLGLILLILLDSRLHSPMYMLLKPMEDPGHWFTKASGCGR